MVVKVQDKDNYDAYRRCDPKIKNGLVEIVNSFDKLFK